MSPVSCLFTPVSHTVLDEIIAKIKSVISPGYYGFSTKLLKEKKI